MGVGRFYGFSESEREELNNTILSHFPQARVMATIGVTRGLGDHNLRVCSSTLPIKPFLSCFPEVSTPSFPQAALTGFYPGPLYLQPPFLATLTPQPSPSLPGSSV